MTSRLKSTLLLKYTLLCMCIPALFFANLPKTNIEPIVKLTAEKKSQISGIVADQPVRFIENKGQIRNTADMPVPFVLFKAEANGLDVYITEKGITYVFVKSEEEEEDEKERKHGKENENKYALHEEKMKTELSWVNVFLKDASIKKENIIKEKQSLEHFNFFDSNSSQGIYDIFQYEKITIKNVYPGIDWVFYNSNNDGMKYDFILHPGSNAKQIKLIYDSEKPLNIDNKGNIQIKTRLGTLTENAPYSYLQQTHTEIKTGFVKHQINKHKVEINFNIDTSIAFGNQPLVIDPQLEWGTFIGGNGLDGPLDIATDQAGNVFITGYTSSANFPLLALTGAYNQTYASTGGVTQFYYKI